VKPVVALFAKPVVPGRVKTRLVPPLAPEAAASLYAAFLGDLAGMLSGDARWEWCVASTDPAAQRETWPEAPAPPSWLRQSGADLGERLSRVLEGLLASGRDRVIAVGSDHPTLTSGMVAAALDALPGADVALGPTEDGGYYLVGASHPVPGLFTGVPWSTPRVREATETNARRLGLTVATLAPWYDVDSVEDLLALRRRLVTLDPAVAPRTRRVLAGLTLPGPVA
jgi:rSAM/selenodomain-associated transferase 1